MLDAWGDHPVVAETLREASGALGEDLGKLIKEGPKEALALTTNTQPVMLVAAIAAYRVWMSEVGVAPQMVAGHSLGEYSALVASGVLSLTKSGAAMSARALPSELAIDAMVVAIKSNLKKGNMVTLVGFGTFYVGKRAARSGRNPRTGAAIKIKAAKVPKFRPGKALKDALN